MPWRPWHPALVWALLRVSGAAGGDPSLPARIAALPQDLLHRCNASTGDHPASGSNSSTADAAAEASHSSLLGCLFKEWYPPADTPELQQATWLDTDEEGNELGDIGAYGEVTLAGSAQLINAVAEIGGEPLGPSDVFYDFASGLGHLVLQVFLTTGVGRAGGVERGVRRSRLATAAGRAARGLGPTVYGLGTGDGRVYAQALATMTPPRATSTGSDWVPAIGGKVEAIAIWGNEIYAVKADKKVYKQALSAAGPDSDDWRVASGAAVEAVEIYKDTIYAVGTDRCIWKQRLADMAVNSSWIQTSRGSVVGIAIDGATETMYGVGIDMAIYKQALGTMTSASEWSLASKGSVERITIYEGVVYGVAYDKRIWKQPLSTMTPQTDWVPASQDSVSDVAISLHGFHPQQAAEAILKGASPLEFVRGDVLRELDGMEDASVVYLPSLFFDDGFLMSLAWAMSATLRPGTLIFSHRNLLGCWPGLLQVQTIDVLVPWASRPSPVHTFIVTPPPVAPQPAWLVTRGPAAQLAMDALVAAAQPAVEETHAAGATDVVPRRQWAEAGKKAWPGTDEVMLWRLAVAAAPKFGHGQKDSAVPRQALEGIVQERLKGSPDVTPIDCAWHALAVASVTGEPNATRPLWDLEEALLPRLLEKSMADSTGRTVVAVAAEHLDEQLGLQLLRLLLAKGADPEASGPGVTPLARAARRGHTAVAAALLASRAAAEVPNTAQLQPLHLAAAHGHEGVARLLLEQGARLDVVDASGRTPRQVAADIHNLTQLLDGRPAL